MKWGGLKYYSDCFKFSEIDKIKMPLYDEAIYKPCYVLLNKIGTESSVHIIHGESNHIIKMPDAKGSKQDLQGATNSGGLSKTPTNGHKVKPSLKNCKETPIFKTSDVSSFSSDDSDFEHNQNIRYKNWKKLSIHRSRVRILTDSDIASETDIQDDYVHNTGTPIKEHRSSDLTRTPMNRHNAKDLSATPMKELGANYLNSTPKKRCKAKYSFRTHIKAHEANDSDDLSAIFVKDQRSNDLSKIPVKKNAENTVAPNDDHTENTLVPNAKHNLPPQLEMNKDINDYSIIKPCSVILVKLNLSVETDCFEGSLGKLNVFKSKIGCHDSYSKNFCSEKRHCVALLSNHSIDSSLKECSNESFETVVMDEVTKQYSVPLTNIDISEISDTKNSISYVKESDAYDAILHSNKNAMLHSAHKKQNIDEPVIEPKHSEPEPSEYHVRKEIEISNESFVSIGGSLISSADFSDFSVDKIESSDEVNHPMTYYIDKFISDTSNYKYTSINANSTRKYQSKKKVKYFDSSDSSTNVPDVNDVNKEKQISHNLKYSSGSKKKSKYYFDSSDSSEVSDVDHDANKEKQMSRNLRDSLKSKKKRKYFDSSDSSTEVSDVDVVNKEREIFGNERDSFKLSDKRLSECNKLKKQNDAEVNFNLKPCYVVLHKMKEIDVIREIESTLQNNRYLHEDLAFQVQDKKSIKSNYKRTYIYSSEEDVNSVSKKLTTENEFNNSNHSIESETQKICDQICVNNNEEKVESNKIKIDQTLRLDRKSQAGEKTCQPLALKTPNRTINSKYKRICINSSNEDLSAMSSVSNKVTSANKFDDSQLSIVTKNSRTSPANKKKPTNFYLSDQNLKDCDSVKFSFKTYSNGNCVNISQCVNEFCELASPCVSCKVLLSKLNKDTLTGRVSIPFSLNSDNITQIQNDDSNIKASTKASCMIGFKNMFCNQNVKKQRSIVQEKEERADCGTASDASKEADSDGSTVNYYSEFENSVANFETVQTLKDCKNEGQWITNGENPNHSDSDLINNIEKNSKNVSSLNDCREKPILKTSGDSSFLSDNSDFEPNTKIQFNNSKKLFNFKRRRILTDSDSASETDIQNEYVHHTTPKHSIKFCKVFIKSEDKYQKNKKSSMFLQNPKSPVMHSQKNCNKNAASENITPYPFKSKAGDKYVVDFFECENIKKIFVTVSLKDNSKLTEQCKKKNCKGNEKCQFDLKTHPSILKETSAVSEKVKENNMLAEQNETLSPKVSSNSDFCDKRFNKSEKSIQCGQEEITLKSKLCNTNLPEENNNASSAKSDMEGICDLGQDLVDLDYVKNHEKASSYSTITTGSNSNFNYKKVNNSFCIQCFTKFFNTQDNYNHTCSGKQKRGYLCEFCEKIFPTKISISVHKRIHKNS